MRTNEDKIEQIESREKQADIRLSKLEEDMKKAQKATSEAQKDTLKVVFEEVRERDERRFNVIFHNIGESIGDTLEEEKDWDANSFDNVMDVMHTNLTFKESATYSRRLGARRPGQARPRPLLVVLKSEQDRTAILANSHQLALSRLNEVSVVPDLTKQQREADEDLRREAARRNREELSEEDKAKNMRWVTVGRKGMRKIIKKEWRERGNHGHPTGSRPTQMNRKRAAEVEVEKDGTNKKQRNQASRGADPGEEEEEAMQDPDEEVERGQTA